MHLPLVRNVPDRLRSLDEVLAATNQWRADRNLPQRDPADFAGFLRRAAEAAVGVGTTAALVVTTFCWLVLT